MNDIGMGKIEKEVWIYGLGINTVRANPLEDFFDCALLTVGSRLHVELELLTFHVLR